jgi:hypothetical protein
LQKNGSQKPEAILHFLAIYLFLHYSIMFNHIWPNTGTAYSTKRSFIKDGDDSNGLPKLDNLQK